MVTDSGQELTDLAAVTLGLIGTSLLLVGFIDPIP